jgi:hypothetical protein
MELIEVTISGSYRNSKKEHIDYDGVKFLMPAIDEETRLMHIKTRYALASINADPRYKEERAASLRQVFIDDVKPVKGKPSFLGKKIKELTDPEMQDLATAKDLRGIPAPSKQSGLSLREMRIRAYAEYVEKVLKLGAVKWREPDFNFAAQPDFEIKDAAARKEKAVKVTNEEFLENESRNTSLDKDDPSSRFTLKELQQLAQSKNIDYDGLSLEQLYAKLYKAA